jgi:hypothetical protein
VSISDITYSVVELDIYHSSVALPCGNIFNKPEFTHATLIRLHGEKLLFLRILALLSAFSVIIQSASRQIGRLWRGDGRHMFSERHPTPSRTQSMPSRHNVLSQETLQNPFLISSWTLLS